VKNKMTSEISSVDILKTISDATVDIIARTSPSVVSIQAGMGGGTGVVWSQDGYIVTANHVVHRARSVRVGFGDGSQVEAKVVGRDPYSDIALLKVEGDSLKPVEVGDSEKINVGELVIALANPFNGRPAATSGIVTGVRSPMRGMQGVSIENVIITDARLNPGYSGGPLIDATGTMIGMNAAIAWHRGIAIPVSTVKTVVERLMKGGEVKRAYMGVFMAPIPVPREVAEAAKITQERAVMVLRVEPDSPAKKAGIAFGDIVVRFNDKPVVDVSDLPRLLTEDLIGKKTKIALLRGEKLVELTITPTSAKEEESE
jgi:S1-C subfamily serine protease